MDESTVSAASPRSDSTVPSSDHRAPSDPGFGSARTSDLRVEDYLDRACAPLIPEVAFARRQELRAEWREHLEALIEARGELGEDPDTAVTEALRQFGDADRLGRDWLRTRHRTAGHAPQWLRLVLWRSIAYAFLATLAIHLTMGWHLGHLGRGMMIAALWVFIIRGSTRFGRRCSHAR